MWQRKRHLTHTLLFWPTRPPKLCRKQVRGTTHKPLGNTRWAIHIYPYVETQCVYICIHHCEYIYVFINLNTYMYSSMWIHIWTYRVFPTLMNTYIDAVRHIDEYIYWSHWWIHISDMSKYFTLMNTYIDSHTLMNTYMDISCVSHSWEWVCVSAHMCFPFVGYICEYTSPHIICGDAHTHTLMNIYMDIYVYIYI